MKNNISISFDRPNDDYIDHLIDKYKFTATTKNIYYEKLNILNIELKHLPLFRIADYLLILNENLEKEILNDYISLCNEYKLEYLITNNLGASYIAILLNKRELFL